MMSKTNVIYTNAARWFCKETTGRDRTWPSTYNDTCPECGEEFVLDDKILVAENGDGEQVVHHYDCYTLPKPEFEEEVVT